MKLGFVIPLKSQLVSRDWNSVECCLRRTLKSLANQTSDEWVAVVVGHEQPDLDFGSYSERVFWVAAEHDVPPVRKGGSFAKFADFNRIEDKNKKTMLGMRMLRRFSVSAWFVLDADDLLHRDLVRVWASQPRQAGWVIDRGYIYYSDVERVLPTTRLTHICGSTTIIDASVFALPEGTHSNGPSKVPWHFLSHSDMRAFLVEKTGGMSVDFPLHGIAYTLATGDNVSDEFRATLLARLKVWTKKHLMARRVSRKFARDFGLRMDASDLVSSPRSL